MAELAPPTAAVAAVCLARRSKTSPRCRGGCGSSHVIDGLGSPDFDRNTPPLNPKAARRPFTRRTCLPCFGRFARPQSFDSQGAGKSLSLVSDPGKYGGGRAGGCCSARICCSRMCTPCVAPFLPQRKRPTHPQGLAHPRAKPAPLVRQNPSMVEPKSAGVCVAGFCVLWFGGSTANHSPCSPPRDPIHMLPPTPKSMRSSRAVHD